MNRSEAYDIEKKYGKDAYHLALDILDKERIISHWEGKKNTAQYYIEQNQEKIKKIQVKLDKAKSG